MSLNLTGIIERGPNQFLPKAKIHECDQCHEYDESNQCLRPLLEAGKNEFGTNEVVNMRLVQMRFPG